VIPIINLGPGPGSLSGKITEGVGYGQRGGVFAPGNPIGGLNIKGGKNPGGTIVSQGKTNSAGEYTLSNLPVNLAGETYFIMVDIPGLDTNSTYNKAITTGSTQYANLNFVVDSAKINPSQTTGIREVVFDNAMIKIYPNPTSHYLNIDLKLQKPETLEIKLNDMTGKEVKTILPAMTNFNSELKMRAALNDLDNGLYLLKIKVGDTEKTIKIIIVN
jgi:hypothetical protein